MEPVTNRAKLVTEEGIKHVCEILDEMHARKKNKSHDNKTAKRLLGQADKLILHGFITMAIEILFGAYYFAWQSEAALTTAYTFAVFAILTGFSILILSISASSIVIFDAGRNPSKHFSNLLKDSIDFDLPYTYRLASCDINALTYVLFELRLERNEMEKRGGLLSGLIDKIGIFPAIGSTLILVAAIDKMGPSYSSLQIIPPLILTFQCINFFVSILIQRLDRSISLFEYVLEMKD